MTAPAELSEVQSAATERGDYDGLLHAPRCGDADTAMCGADLTGATWCSDGLDCAVCDELDEMFPCICEPMFSCCAPAFAGVEPVGVIFDELHYFTGGAA